MSLPAIGSSRSCDKILLHRCSSKSCLYKKEGRKEYDRKRKEGKREERGREGKRKEKKQLRIPIGTS